MFEVDRPQGFYPREPLLKWLEDDRHMELVQDVTYVSEEGIGYTAHAGLVVDGKTTPRALWWTKLAGPPYVGPGRVPSLIHDQMCKQAEEEDSYELRDFADDLFKEMLDYKETCEVKEHAMWAAVSLNGVKKYFKQWWKKHHG